MAPRKPNLFSVGAYKNKLYNMAFQNLQPLISTVSRGTSVMLQRQAPDD